MFRSSPSPPSSFSSSRPPLLFGGGVGGFTRGPRTRKWEEQEGSQEDASQEHSIRAKRLLVLRSTYSCSQISSWPFKRDHPCDHRPWGEIHARQWHRQKAHAGSRARWQVEVLLITGSSTFAADIERPAIPRDRLQLHSCFRQIPSFGHSKSTS